MRTMLLNVAFISRDQLVSLILSFLSAFLDSSGFALDVDALCVRLNTLQTLTCIKLESRSPHYQSRRIILVSGYDPRQPALAIPQASSSHQRQLVL